MRSLCFRKFRKLAPLPAGHGGAAVEKQTTETDENEQQLAIFNQAVRYLLLAMDHVKNMIDYHNSASARSPASPPRRSAASTAAPAAVPSGLSEALQAADDELEEDVNDSMLADAIARLTQLRLKVRLCARAFRCNQQILSFLMRCSYSLLGLSAALDLLLRACLGCRLRC